MTQVGNPDLYRELVQTLLVPFAVLGLHFSSTTPGRFAVAASTGGVHFYSFHRDGHAFMLDEFTITVAPSSDILVLSLKWSSESSSMAITMSNGDVAILDTESLQVKYSVPQAHSLEVWTAAWSLMPGSSALYTGGDDSVLCCHHLDNLQSPSDFVRDSKIHGAGVTAILPIWADKNYTEIILTGSYEEHIRVVQITLGKKKADVLLEQRLGGGVWQLKQLRCPQHSETEDDKVCFWVLASCMHAGCRVLKITWSVRGDGKWTADIVGKFEEHGSMNYASDAQPCRDLRDMKDITFVSTSFYDNKLCVWTLEDT